MYLYAQVLIFLIAHVLVLIMLIYSLIINHLFQNHFKKTHLKVKVVFYCCIFLNVFIGLSQNTWQHNRFQDVHGCYTAFVG